MESEGQIKQQKRSIEGRDKEWTNYEYGRKKQHTKRRTQEARKLQIKEWRKEEKSVGE